MMFLLDVFGQFCSYLQQMIAHLWMWVRRGGTVWQFWATNNMQLLWVWVGTGQRGHYWAILGNVGQQISGTSGGCGWTRCTALCPVGGTGQNQPGGGLIMECTLHTMHCSVICTHDEHCTLCAL